MHMNVCAKSEWSDSSGSSNNNRWNNKQITKPIYATDLNSLETMSTESANKERK